MRKLRLNLQQTQSDVWIGYDLPEQLNRLRLQGKSRRAFLVVDRVLKQTASSWVSELQEAGWRVDVHFVRASESLKSYSSLEPIYSWLIEKGADRNSVIFAIGGGTVGDAVGFVAGTYLRGIRWVSVPTTLLAQVDSGLGGKTAMNHRLGKNLIGVFHQPVAVLCDVGFLKTLPKREFTSGLGEIVKYGIALDRALFKYIESRTREGVQELFADSQGLEYLVWTCLKLKKSAVEKDEFDRNGLRAVLNFGHTLGHLFEAETGYSYFRHGEAVIWGMRGAIYLSILLGLLPKAQGIEIDHVLRRFKLPGLAVQRTFSDRWNLLMHDKKARDGVLNFVLLEGVGQARADQPVGQKEIREVLGWLAQKKGAKIEL